MSKLTETLKFGSDKMAIPINEEMLYSFSKYWEFLENENRLMNLTAITGEEEVAAKHFLDCLGLFKTADFKGSSIIDIGSGAGFPGMPIRIVEPTARLTLVDSQKKRVSFLENLCDLTGCADVTCIHGRAEELAMEPEYRDTFDFAVSRAVARLNILCELCLPFVRVGGKLLAMKSSQCDEEICQAENAINVLGGRLLPCVEYNIPETDFYYKIVIIEKITRTPEGYPRKFARISKKTL